MGAMTHDINAFREVLSESEAFQDWCAAADADEALGHITTYAGSIQSVSPLAVISLGPGWEANVQSLGGTFLVSPEITVLFFERVTKSDADESVLAAIVAHVDDVMDDIMAQSVNGYQITGWAPEDAATPARFTHSVGLDGVVFAVSISCDDRTHEESGT